MFSIITFNSYRKSTSNKLVSNWYLCYARRIYPQINTCRFDKVHFRVM